MQILFIELFLLIVQIDGLAFDEQLPHLSFRFQRVAVGHQQIRPLAFFDGAHAIAYAPDFRGVPGNGLQRVIVGKAERYRLRRLMKPCITTCPAIVPTDARPSLR